MAMRAVAIALIVCGVAVLVGLIYKDKMVPGAKTTGKPQRSQSDMSVCQADTCLNGGTCKIVKGSYKCTCPPGYEGENCEANKDECWSAPCQNEGLCLDGVNGYTCQCGTWYTGTHCENVFCASRDMNVVSSNSETTAKIAFLNQASREVELYWVNFEGQEFYHDSIQPDAVIEVNSFVSHVFVARDAETKQQIFVDDRCEFVVPDIQFTEPIRISLR